MAAGCYGLAMSVFGTTLSLFLADAVGAGPGLIGLYFTGCAVIGLAINLTVGGLSDRRIALAATALAGVAGALVFTGARDYALVFAAGAVLLGLNEACISQLFAYVKEFADATAREVTPSSSAVRSVFSVGWVIGPPVGLFLLAHAGFGRMYAGAAALLLVTAVLGRWFLPALPRPTPEEGTGGRHGSGMRQILAIVPRRSWLLLGKVTAGNVANQMYLIAVALYVTKDLGLPASLVGVMAGVCAALEIPLMIMVGRVADRLGKMRVVTAAVILAAVFFTLLPLADSTPALIALQLPNALWIAVISSSPMVQAQQEIPGGTSAVSALYSSTFPVAQLSAGALTDVAAAQAGYRSVFWIGAGPVRASRRPPAPPEGISVRRRLERSDVTIRFVSVVGGDTALLDAAAIHYRDLGVDPFHIVRHIESWEDPDFQRSLDVMARHGLAFAAVHQGPWDEDLNGYLIQAQMRRHPKD
ncbi:sugar efflux transporter [Streptomyces sp. NPDC059201]|uniref:sugar efflux transporter n=1 Tax=Streptomyces sp. NPDC059201 TaxID=3346767 RepID=UPI0036A2B358